MPEPFKSALSLGVLEDTSLALPSDHHMRSAQQRVLDQVGTIKRTKSKYSSKSVSGLPSPTSEFILSVYFSSNVVLLVKPVNALGIVVSACGAYGRLTSCLKACFVVMHVCTFDLII